jgi:hypothetical protein
VDLTTDGLRVDLLRSPAPPAWTEHIGSTALELGLPRRDLIGMDVELLCKLPNGSIALDGGKRHLRLESRTVVPARSSRHDLS